MVLSLVMRRGERALAANPGESLPQRDSWRQNREYIRIL